MPRNDRRFIALQSAARAANSPVRTRGGAHLALEYFAACPYHGAVPYKGRALDDVCSRDRADDLQARGIAVAAKAGKLRILAVTSTKRLPRRGCDPDRRYLPGSNHLHAGGWWCRKTPKPSSPAARRDREGARSKEIESRPPRGSEIGGIPHEAFARYIKAEIAKWTRV